MVSHSKNILVAGIAAILVCLMLASCSNDEVLDSCNPSSEESCDYICFGFPADRQMARAGYADKAEVSDRFMLRSADSTDSLYMSAVVTDGIRSESDARGVHTCAAPVTKDNFAPNGFHVWAFWKTGSTLNPLYMNETVKDKGSNVWSSERVHYWPGADHTLRFFAYAPKSSSISVPENENNPDNATLKYTVSDNVSAQYDIVVATTAEIPGNNNATVPLTFRHICTAIRFVVGSQMQPGRIESVTLKGVYNSGTYNMAASSWSLSNTTDNFTQTVSKVVDGTETAGTEITPADKTFMMLPQTLPSGATVEVVFANEANVYRTLTTSIAGSAWPMGKTVTYKLSVSPEYELEFVTEAPTLDAHYVMYPLEIKAGSNIPGNSWIVKIENGITWATLKKENQLLEIEKDGYWIDNNDPDYTGKRTGSVTSTVVNANDIVYLFLEENYPATADRTVSLSLAPTSKPNSVTDRITVTQLPVGNYNSEQIEEDSPLPWGFAWDSNATEQFIFTGAGGGHIPPGHMNKIKAALRNAGIDPDNMPEYITLGEGKNGNILLTIDYSKINIEGISLSESNGCANTLELYNFDGISYISSLKDVVSSLENVQKVDGTSGNIENPEEFAALAALKKNKFNLKVGSGTAGGSTATIYVPELPDANANWYLPAKNEYALLPDLSGEYWTSTAVFEQNDRTKAWKFISPSGSEREMRMTPLKIHAVRKQ